MSTPNLAPAVADPVSVATPPAVVPPPVTTLHPSERTPSNWNLSMEGELLVGVNRHTHRQFSGTHAEFNALLKS